jgi:hypothetical protein
MIRWPVHPIIYEVNTWVWLDEIGRKYMRPITLGTVPASEWDHIAELPIDAVWLMGVWERSPIGTQVMRNNNDLLRYGKSMFVGFTTNDIVGSPYCIRQYVPDEHLGGFEGLKKAREELQARGLKLVLDYVPNHVALDHPWVDRHPEYFVQGDAIDLERSPTEFIEVAGRVMAFGRDPYFPPWIDVLQLNTFRPEVRTASADVLSMIAEHCDGVRCDMAMLPMNDIFARTWDSRVGPAPTVDYWIFVIEVVKGRHPNLVLIAEAYWDLEWELLQQGFNYCYDKQLYDRLIDGNLESVRLHLQADNSYQQQLVRFIENHDEERAAKAFLPDAVQAAAVTVGTLPGAGLYYDGQFEARRIRLPVSLGRRPDEPVNVASRQFYHRLLTIVRDLRQGEWRLCEVAGWPDNDSWRNIIAWSWQTLDAIHIIAVNLSSMPSQGRVRLPWRSLPANPCLLIDGITGQSFERNRTELLEAGLYVDLDKWQFHVLRLSV